MPNTIDPSKLTEEIDGVEQPKAVNVTLKRPDGNPAVFPENLAEQLISEKGFTRAESGEFTEQREANVQKSFELANADEIRKALLITQIVEKAVASAK